MARLSKEQLADRGRFKFKKETVELSELGGSVVVKTLTVGERDALPDLVDKDGKSIATVKDLAKVFAAAVEDPKVTAAEAAEFLGDWPATALDEVIMKFGELFGNKEERDAAASEFRGSDD